MVAATPPGGISPDLPRTMACACPTIPTAVSFCPRGRLSLRALASCRRRRIRRLVRENPNDRELQRLLHTLLTSMSADRIDEAAIRSVLSQMERAHAAKPGLSPAPALPGTQFIPHGLRASLASPPGALAPPPHTPPAAPAHDAAPPATPPPAWPPATAHAPLPPAASPPAAPAYAGYIADAYAAAGAAPPLPAPYGTPPPRAGATLDADAPPPSHPPPSSHGLASLGLASHAPSPSPSHGAASRGEGGAPLEAMRRRHEHALAAMRQKAYRDARQAQAHHE